MKINELLTVVVLAMLTTWSIEYLFFGRNPFNQEKQSTSQVVEREVRPLAREIDFVDVPNSKQEERTVVDVPYGRFVFTSHGAALDEATFFHKQQEQVSELTTIAPTPEESRENKSLLVATERNTPYFYELRDVHEDDQYVTIVYQVRTHDASITKTFAIHKNIHAIDVSVDIDPKNDATTLRLVCAAPLFMDAKNKAAVVSTDNKNIIIERSEYKLRDLMWVDPKFAGGMDKYFVHAMVSDTTHLVDRAYYNADMDSTLMTMVESKRISKPTTWTTRWYMGPKTEEAMRPVDELLIQTLDYAGWLTPLTQLFLKLMKLMYQYLHNYGYVIIALTCLLNLLFLPVSLKGNKSEKEREEFKHKLAYIKKRYAHDPETLQREQTALVQKHGMPGAGGCLISLLRLPVLLALTPLLGNSMHLYKAPFAWIPDLSARDPYFILPLLIFLSMFTYAATLDKEQRMMFRIVAVGLGVFSINFSAGLSLYILVSSLFTFVQSSLIPKKRA